MGKSFKDSPALRFLTQADDDSSENTEEPYAVSSPNNEPFDIPQKRRRHVKHEFTFEEEMARAHFSEKQARIAGAVILDPRLSYSDFKLFAVLCLYQNYKTGVCWPSYSEINRKFGFPLSSIKASINRLIEYGYVSRRKEDGIRTYYTLYPFNVAEEKEKRKKE